MVGTTLIKKDLNLDPTQYHSGPWEVSKSLEPRSDPVPLWTKADIGLIKKP